MSTGHSAPRRPTSRATHRQAGRTAVPPGCDLGAAIRDAAPQVRTGAWTVLACETTRVQHHLRKRIVFGRLVYRDCATGRVLAVEIVAKAHDGNRGVGRGRHALRALQALWDAGFRPPASWLVPQPYGYSPSHHALLQGVAPGRPWGTTLHEPAGSPSPALAEASAAAAQWLCRLQHSQVAGCLSTVQAPPDAGLAGSAGAIYRLADGIASAAPPVAPRLLPLAATLAEQLDDRRASATLVPSHGDYHPENVFVADGATTVIDFDRFGWREAAFDAGYAIGQLLVMSYLRCGTLAPGALAAQAFWLAYAQQGRAAWRRVAVHAARALLLSLHYEVSVLRIARPDLLHLWPNLIHDWLESDDPRTLEDLVRRR